MGWTEQQQEAIDQRDKNLLISAAAGSGKTAVLVERIISLILKDGVDIDRLLIVTFTNAAAAEMRERIAAALADALEQGQNQELIRRQLHLLQKASVSTLHAFCSTVIRKHFYRLGIDPAFKIGDMTELTLLKKEAVTEVLEQAYTQQTPEFIALVEAYSENRGDQRLEELLLQMHSFIQSQPDPLDWLEQETLQYLCSDQELLASKWFSGLTSSVFLYLDGIKKDMHQALKICQHPFGPAAYEEAIRNDFENLADFESDLLLFMSGRLAAADVIRVTHKRFKSISKKSDVDPFLQEKVKQIRNTYKDYLNKLYSKDFLSREPSEYAQDLRRMNPVLQGLLALVSDFTYIYGQKKKEKRILDFNDLEHMTLTLLSDPHVAQGFINHYQYIFIDEYQDSNIVQETIINRIKRENNLFFVGDVKQSIYRFRLADPGLFIEKYKSFSYKDPLNQRIDLTKNFRSRHQVLDSVNYIFRLLMSEQIGEIEYSEDAWLYPGADFAEIENPETEIHIIDKGDVLRQTETETETDTDMNNEADSELLEISDAEAEALLLVKRIRELLGTKTYDNKQKAYRDITFKDIVILLRSTKNWADVFHEVFIKEGFPVYVDQNTGYFETLEIKLFMNLLTVIDNKRDDLALLSVMRSSVFGFSATEMMEIRNAGKSGSYHHAVFDYAEANENVLAEKISRMLSDLDRWREEAMDKKTDDFLWELLLDTGFYYLAGSWPGGTQRQANLMILVERAAAFEKSGRTGLFAFIKYAQLFKKASGDMGTARTIGENENVLRIMTIHKSKGLEFPVVIVAGLGRSFNMGDTQGKLLLHKNLGVGLTFVDPEQRVTRDSLSRMALSSRIRMDSLSEELRVLYVAMTRAKDRLILLGGNNNIKKSAENWAMSLSDYKILTAGSFLDWLGFCLIRHADGQVLRDLVPSESIIGQPVNDQSRWQIQMIPKHDLLTKRSETVKNKEKIKELLEHVPQEIIDQDLLKETKRRFSWTYPAGAADLPSKITVSDIKKAEMQGIESIGLTISPLVKQPDFLRLEKTMTQAEQGTIIHYVMQHADLRFVSTIRQIEEQVSQMVNRRLLTEEEARVIKPQEILTFFKSSLGQRMLSSEKIEREIGFVYPVPACQALKNQTSCSEQVYVQGVIDCFFEEEDQIVLLDYKSDSVMQDATELIEKYGAQVKIYKEALESISGKKVKESFIYSFALQKEINVP